MTYQSVVTGLALTTKNYGADGTYPAPTLDYLSDKIAAAFEKKGRTSANPAMPPEDIENVIAIAKYLLLLGVSGDDEISDIRLDPKTYELITFSPCFCKNLEGEIVIKYGNKELLLDRESFASAFTAPLAARLNKEGVPYGLSLPIEIDGFKGGIPVRLKKFTSTADSVRFFDAKKARSLSSITDQLGSSVPLDIYDNYLPIGTRLKVIQTCVSAKPTSGGRSIPQFVLVMENGQTLTLDQSCFSRQSVDLLKSAGLTDDDGNAIEQVIIKVDVRAQTDKEGNARLKRDGTPWMQSIWAAPAFLAIEEKVMRDAAANLAKHNETNGLTKTLDIRGFLGRSE
jgi:hypothetical protein